MLKFLSSPSLLLLPRPVFREPQSVIMSVPLYMSTANGYQYRLTSFVQQLESNHVGSHDLCITLMFLTLALVVYTACTRASLKPLTRSIGCKLLPVSRQALLYILKDQCLYSITLHPGSKCPEINGPRLSTILLVKTHFRIPLHPLA